MLLAAPHIDPPTYEHYEGRQQRRIVVIAYIGIQVTIQRLQHSSSPSIALSSLLSFRCTHSSNPKLTRPSSSTASPSAFWLLPPPSPRPVNMAEPSAGAGTGELNVQSVDLTECKELNQPVPLQATLCRKGVYAILKDCPCKVTPTMHDTLPHCTHTPALLSTAAVAAADKCEADSHRPRHLHPAS